ncbi:MAG TPA: AI-2E family transporter [Gammaproteobacteria bacterium]|nr:AI-2E family transporter [Gammaproteobacteria bacterium]
MQTSTLSAPLRLLIGLAAFVVIIAGMKASADILMPFLLAAFISIIAAPAIFWLERRKVPAALAITLVVLAVVLFFTLVGTLIGTSVNDFTQQLPDYQSRLGDEINAVTTWLNARGLISLDGITQYVDPGKAMQLASNFLKGLGGVLSNTALIFLTAVFMLAEASSFPRKLRLMLGPDGSMGGFQQFLDRMNAYVKIKTLTSLGTGILVSLWLLILGVDYALLWGVLAFLLNYVPNIGSIIASVPAVLLAFIQHGTLSAILTAVGYIVVNVGIDNFIAPRFTGRGVGLSTLIVFLSLLFWGWVLGPVGMLLSVPLTMIAKIALDSREDTRWLGILLGPEGGDEPAAETALKKKAEKKPKNAK